LRRLSEFLHAEVAAMDLPDVQVLPTLGPQRDPMRP
jgi:hypothetical protein